jgi:hypothetical protein
LAEEGLSSLTALGIRENASAVDAVLAGLSVEE